MLRVRGLVGFSVGSVSTRPQQRRPVQQENHRAPKGALWFSADKACHASWRSGACYIFQSLPRVSPAAGVTAAHQVSAETVLLTGRALPSPKPTMMLATCPELGRYKLHCLAVG